MNETQKSVLATLLMVGGTAAMMGWALLYGHGLGSPFEGELKPLSPLSVAVKPASPGSEPEPYKKPSPAGEDSEILSRSAQMRVTFAASLQKRYRAKGMTIEVKAEGRDRATLAINWPAKPDDDHVSGVQQAEPLHRELRDIGFVLLQLRHEGQDTWRLKL